MAPNHARFATPVALLLAAFLLVACPSSPTPNGNGDGPTPSFVLTVHPIGQGTIESEPHAIDCPGACDATFDENTTIRLVAYPHEGHTLFGWAGDHDCSDGFVTLTRDTRCVALFADAATASNPLVIDLVGHGRVTSDPAGIDCPSSDCIALYPRDTLVMLAPTPDDGHSFDGWAGDPDCNDGQVTLTTSIACTAVFQSNDAPSHLLDVSLTPGGTVISTPSGIDCPGGACYALFGDGTVVTLTPTPDRDYAFSGWSGDGECVGGQLTMTTDHACTATFTPTVATYDLAVSVQGNGSVTSSPAGIQCGTTCQATYTEATKVSLQPTPDGGHSFSGWSGDPDCTDGNVDMTHDTACTATFAAHGPPQNQRPDLAPIADQTTLIGERVSVPLTVQDEAPETVILTGSSSDSFVVATSDLAFTGSGNHRTLQITPTPCHAGTTRITITATDAQGLQDAETFYLQIHKPFQDGPARLAASDGTDVDMFGRAVAIAGDDVIIGAPSDAWNGIAGGSAYAFAYDGGRWIEVDHLVASDAADGDFFGTAVDIDGDYAIIGASSADAAPNDPQAGAAYIFQRSGETWTEIAILTADVPRAVDHFGWSVAIDGDHALVGAPHRDVVSGGDNAGAAYVFERGDLGWTQVAMLTAMLPSQGAVFGTSVDIEGEYAIVGASSADVAGLAAGAAYVFQRDETGWTEVAKLTGNDAAEGDGFGWSTAIAGDTIFVGAPAHDHGPGNDNEGAAYVFQLGRQGWGFVSKLTASDAGGTDVGNPATFGNSVSADGDYAVVGSDGDDRSGGGGDEGSAYVFQRCGDTWKQTATLAATTPSSMEYFGFAVSIDRERIVVGACRTTMTPLAEGSAYIFAR